MIGDVFATLHAEVHGLSDPSQVTGDTSVRGLKRWVQTLPVAHTVGAAEQLRARIDELNASRLRASRRRALLRHLEPATLQLLGQLREGYRDGVQPLPDTAQQHLHLALALHEAMVRGYRLVHDTALKGSRAANHASGRLLHYAGLALLESHFTHMTPPRGLWSLIHDHGLAHGPRRAGARYRQLLLAAASNPWGLAGADILAVYDHAGRLAHRLRLAAAGAAAEGWLAVSPDSDTGPMPIAVVGGPKQQIVAMDTRAVVRHIQRELDAGKRPWPLRRSVSADTHRQLGAMQAGLAAALPRQFPRRPASGEAELVAGMTRIHHTLSGEPVTPRVAEFQARAVQNAHVEADVWNLIFPAEELLEKHDDQGSPQRAKPAPSSAARWSMVDRSAGGYRVQVGDIAGGPLRVGELVLIREHVEAQSLAWELGVMRWLRHYRGGQLEAGVQVISPCPEPVRVRAEGSNGRLTDPFGALLTPAMPRLGMASTLLVPPLAFADNRPLWLQTARGAAPLTLRECMEHQTGFARYTFNGNVDSGAAPGS